MEAAAAVDNLLMEAAAARSILQVYQEERVAQELIGKALVLPMLAGVVADVTSRLAGVATLFEEREVLAGVALVVIIIIATLNLEVAHPLETPVTVRQILAGVLAVLLTIHQILPPQGVQALL
tara:strand:- start:539 stop:907 length:369 start_codon:yes stop_codon:yes gene_type:complete